MNDLHKAAGGEPNHAPAQFFRLDQTEALIQELSNCADMHSKAPVDAKKGRYGGTFVCREVVYAYAMWIASSIVETARLPERSDIGMIGTLPQPPQMT